MTDRKKTITHTGVIALCLAIAGTSFLLGIFTAMDARNRQCPCEMGESFVDRYDVPDVGMHDDVTFFNHTLATRFVIDFIRVNTSLNSVEKFNIIPALAHDGGTPLWLGTTDKPIFDAIPFSLNDQYAYPCSTTVTLPVNPDYQLFLYVHHVSAVPIADFTIVVGYTVYS